ncbi:30S ribosomal protein S17e [Candidatus Woesearchaeota archaeon]|nr:30S ribosomal protein S17e [Candidatus Woesearchaeota archaeon]
MGRVKTQLIKRLTMQLLKLYGQEFKEDFDPNKKLVELYLEGYSKKLRNTVAGYVTRMMKRKESWQ